MRYDRSTGTGLIKLDLHVHTPKSACYADKSVTAEQTVDAALACGLAAIAVTDHNTAEGIDEIREAGERKGLSVFPGIEVSAKEGHVLALFETETPKGELEKLLDEMGIARAGRGDAHLGTGGNMEDVFRNIVECGGIAIAAHIERWPSGFLESNVPLKAKASIHASEYLSALEITVPENRRQWNEGQMWGYSGRRACIQSSDAHSLKEIGRRPVYARMEDVSLASLKSALCEYETGIVFPEDLPQQ